MFYSASQMWQRVHEQELLKLLDSEAAVNASCFSCELASVVIDKVEPPMKEPSSKEARMVLRMAIEAGIITKLCPRRTPEVAAMIWVMTSPAFAHR